MVFEVSDPYWEIEPDMNVQNTPFGERKRRHKELREDLKRIGARKTYKFEHDAQVTCRRLWDELGVKAIAVETLGIDF